MSKVTSVAIVCVTGFEPLIGNLILSMLSLLVLFLDAIAIANFTCLTINLLGALYGGRKMEQFVVTQCLQWHKTISR